MKTAYSYTGGTPVDTDVATALDIKVKFAGDTTVYTPVSDTANFSYEISYPAGFIGNATITIRSNTSGGFRGVINKSFKMVPAYKLATVARVNEYFESEVQYYKETSWNEQEYSVGLEKIAAPHTPLIRNVDYKVSYSGINKVGTATVTYTGIGAYTGVIKKSYKIVNKTPELKVMPSDVEYTQGGVFNAVGAVYCSTVDKDLSPVDELLTPNVDYTVTYTNNKAPGVAGYTVKGKGSYANATPVSGSFTIKTADITKCTITVPDKAYSSKKGAFKSVPVITAPNGKKLVAGKDYDKNIEYFYDDWDDVNSPYYNCPPAGSVVNVKVTGIGAYAGKYITGCYCVYDSKNNGMKKLCIAIDDKVYTGKPAELDVDKDIHVYLSAADMKAKKNEQKPASNYVRIISYKNNIASGKATVTLGNSFSKTATIYGGTKNVTYKILKKNYELPKAVTGITLDYSTFTLNSVTYMDYGTIKATITPADATNKNIQWKTSNPAIVDISYSGAICNISAKGAGTCVISAITQDGAKVAKCTVTSNYKPLQSITLPEKAEVYMGSSINLSYTRVPADGYIGSAVATWTVEDSSIATVNSAGKVTGVTPGETYVTCSIAGKSAKCKIVVDGPKPIDRIKLSSELITLKVNDTKTLTCTIEPSDAHTTTYAWSSSNTSVATVDSTGKVKAVAVGEAVISVKNYNMTATCIVKVRQNAYPLAFNVTKEEDYNDLPIGPGAGPAKPNDGTNDANSIRWAFTALRNTSIGYNAVYIPSGVYDLTCSEYGGLDITGMKNVTLYMDPDTVLKINGSKAGIVGVSISNCQNFTIVGGIIEGNISDISFDGGKSGSCSAVTVINSKGVTLDGVTIRNSVGDGISLLGNENVTIKNCLITKCKDSGVSLDRNEAVGSINITNSIISDIGGYSYGGYGISCGVNEYNIKNIYVKNCSFYNNSKDDFFTPKAGTGVKSVISDITFDGCSFSGAVDIGSGTNIKFINTVRKPKKYYNAVTKSSVFPG